MKATQPTVSAKPTEDEIRDLPTTSIARADASPVTNWKTGWKPKPAFAPACGVCHTDVHAADGDWPVKPNIELSSLDKIKDVLERLRTGKVSGRIVLKIS